MRLTKKKMKRQNVLIINFMKWYIAIEFVEMLIFIAIVNLFIVLTLL